MGGDSKEFKGWSELAGNRKSRAEMTRPPAANAGGNSDGQWVRHRTFHFQSANAQSGRYTPFDENDFYVPSVWRKQSGSNKQASEGEVTPEVNAALTAKLAAFYDEGYRLYEEALEQGVSKEMARLFLPGFSVYYTWVIKTDALNLMNWIRLRMANDAQYEIRVYAEAIYEQFFKAALPWTAEAFDQYVLRLDDQPGNTP